jgi:cytosolic carboxypeptidase protein 6
MPDYTVNQSFHGVESATSKNWIYKQFGTEAVTYEVGDETDRRLLKHIGETAADALMQELLTRTSGKRNKKK